MQSSVCVGLWLGNVDSHVPFGVVPLHCVVTRTHRTHRRWTGVVDMSSYTMAHRPVCKRPFARGLTFRKSWFLQQRHSCGEVAYHSRAYVRL